VQAQLPAAGATQAICACTFVTCNFKTKTKLKNLLFILLLISSNIIAQDIQFAKNEHIYELDKKIRKGDYRALTEIANYFDSKNPLTEFLGYHIINTVESNVAKRIVQENSFFLDNEIIIDSNTTTNQFKDFLTNNKKKIIFSDLANAFIITPFENRKTEFEIIELTESKQNKLGEKRKELLSLDWVKANKIDKLIEQKNPLALLKLSSVLLKNRYRFEEYQNNQDQIVNLIQLLTKSQIAVPNETNKMSYHIEEDFYETSKVNLVIFFANYYKTYKWDEKSNAFVNPNLIRKKVEIENELFDLLSNENDSIAINSFVKITQLNQQKVIVLASQYDRAGIDFNYALPTFAYRFLKQLVYLTNYCRTENIDYLGNEELRKSIELLKSDFTFRERRKIEDNLINSLTLENITAFEYWSLIYEKEWNLTFSAGRILDIFYSKNWSKLIQDQKYLQTYLLKSKLFANLGIIGICNNYLIKFIGTPDEVFNNFHTNEPLAKTQLGKALVISQKRPVFIEEEKKEWTGNGKIDEFSASFNKINSQIRDKEKYREAISHLLSQIKYEQIGQALNAIDTLIIEPDYLYSFLSRDFGLSFIGNFEKEEVRKEFSENYLKLDELSLYAYYLKTSEIDYSNSENNLDFDKIFEILKFGINNAFVGGGGSTKDNDTYAIIKLLELNFKTTLGYPKKLCCSDNMFACNSKGRVSAWMNYIEKNKLLQKNHDEPISFAYEN
jgi:hypothetical protein